MGDTGPDDGPVGGEPLGKSYTAQEVLTFCIISMWKESGNSDTCASENIRKLLQKLFVCGGDALGLVKVMLVSCLLSVFYYNKKITSHSRELFSGWNYYRVACMPDIIFWIHFLKRLKKSAWKLCFEYLYIKKIENLDRIEFSVQSQKTVFFLHNYKPLYTSLFTLSPTTTFLLTTKMFIIKVFVVQESKSKNLHIKTSLYYSDWITKMHQNVPGWKRSMISAI